MVWRPDHFHYHPDKQAYSNEPYIGGPQPMSTDVKRVSGAMAGAVADIKRLSAEIQAEAIAGFAEVKDTLELSRTFVAEHVAAGRELRALISGGTNGPEGAVNQPELAGGRVEAPAAALPEAPVSSEG